jgi:general secretion pathway protein D
MAVQPQIAANKTSNTITIRATTAVAAIIEKIIETNDNPRAEVVIDVEVLEINRTRAKTFGLNLSDYGLTGVFSPETDPRGSSGDSATFAPNPFNLNTITRGISTADFYMAVPSAVVRFLESDSETKLMAKPQLRGAEGQKITLNLGDEIPVPATVFTPIAQGGTNTNPLTSFNYKTVGIIVEMTPTVTPEGDILLDLLVENSTRGQDVNIAGQNLPSFGTRRVNTRLRLRDGESNLLAGLLREQDRKTLQGVPGLLRLPVLSKLLASNDTQIAQTDIVMLLTPRIVRTRELTQNDLSPIFIGTQQNIGLGGPPPLIAPPPVADPAASLPMAPDPIAAITGGAGASSPAPTPAPAPAPVAPATSAPVAPPSSSPVPGPISSGAQPAPALRSAVSASPGGATVILTPPGNDFRVGGGPYTVAISATDASRLSSVALTLTYNPSALRVRTVQEGSFMRAGGATATFTQQVDASTGRIDIAVIRPSDATGVAGTGLLSAILFDAVGQGPANLSLTGTGTAPGGNNVSLQFPSSPTVTVR